MLDKVTVAVKCRPLSDKERADEEEIFDFFFDDKNWITTPKNKFLFKHTFSPQSTTREVFESIVSPMLEKALLGYNGTILAYGQTGAGKTHTLGTQMTNEPGILDMILENIFQNGIMGIKLSVVEVYLKDCFDLLHSKPLKLNVQGLKPVNAALVNCSNLENAKEVLESAVKNRRVATTAFNAKSSRSHVIISVIIETNFFMSKLNIVDLAGSEKILASAGILRNEGVAINEALHSLGRVINCLALAKSHIPFRDSTLTHLLADSLNNDNYITLIACINSLRKNLEESEKTLEFASKFGGISAPRRIIATPYKTPSRFVNNTFSTGNTGFKKPLTPFNKTIATTPVYWATKKREKAQDTPMLDFRRDTLNSSSNVSLNLSNVSSSTALVEYSSPPKSRMDSLSSTLNDAYNPVAMTPANVDYPAAMTPVNLDILMTTMKQAIENTIKKEMTLLKSQLNVFDQKENTQKFTNRLLDIEAASSAMGDSPPVHDSSSDSDCLQTTVLGQSKDADIPKSEAPSSEPEPVSKMQKKTSNNKENLNGFWTGEPEPVSKMQKKTSNNKENLNGSYISDSDSPDPRGTKDSDQHSHNELSTEAAKRSALRRSYRRSVVKSSDGALDSRDGDNDSSSNSTSDSEVFKKPVLPRCLRRSVLRRAFEESESDEASEHRSDSTDSSGSSEPKSNKRTLPPPRRSVRRSVLSKKLDESGGDKSTHIKGDNTDSSGSSESRSNKRTLPPPRRSVRRSVLSKKLDESRVYKGEKTNSSSSSGEEYSKKAPRRSMRFSILKRPLEETYDTPPKKVRRSLRVSLAKIDPPKKEAEKAVSYHEENVLKILREGTLKELLKLPTVGEKTARLILNDRLLHGPLKTVADYKNIRGLTISQGQKFLWANSLI